MRKDFVFLFSGQGSQYYQMGKQLFLHDEYFYNYMLNLDKIPQRMLGLSIVDIIYDENVTPSDQFSRLLFTHPAIFMVEIALAMSLIQKGIKPSYCLGVSLGEYAALVLNKVIPAEVSLELIIDQAISIENYCSSGFMIAILESPRAYHTYAEIYSVASLVSVNYDNHFVIAGDSKRFDGIIRFLKQMKYLYSVLPVGYGFHSDNIKPAYFPFINSISKNKIANANGDYYSPINKRVITEFQPEYFWDIAAKQFYFIDALNWLRHKTEDNFIYLDLGPGGSLSNFMKYGIKIDGRLINHKLLTPHCNELQNIANLKIN